MHVNESSENYLETILMLSKKLPVVRANILLYLVRAILH